MPMIACGRDPARPGRYLLIRVKRMNPDGYAEGPSILWRDARVQMDQESFAAHARASFADWCRLNGW